MQLRKILPLLALIFCTSLVFSQSTASSDDSHIATLNEIPLMEGDNWTFYLDAENKVYYIDFETISVNLNDVKVINENGDIVLKDKLWDLPVNTIYELNLEDFRPGSYKVELRSYTGMITKEITIAD